MSATVLSCYLARNPEILSRELIITKMKTSERIGDREEMQSKRENIELMVNHLFLKEKYFWCFFSFTRFLRS